MKSHAGWSLVSRQAGREPHPPLGRFVVLRARLEAATVIEQVEDARLLHEPVGVDEQPGKELDQVGGDEIGEVKLGFQQVAKAQRAPESGRQPDLVADPLDDLVGGEKIEQEPQPPAIPPPGRLEASQRTGLLRPQLVDEPQRQRTFQGLRRDHVREEIVDAEEIEVLARLALRHL